MRERLSQREKDQGIPDKNKIPKLAFNDSINDKIWHE